MDSYGDGDRGPALFICWGGGESDRFSKELRLCRPRLLLRWQRCSCPMSLLTLSVVEPLQGSRVRCVRAIVSHQFTL